MIAPRTLRRLAPIAFVLIAGAGWIAGPRVLRSVDYFAVRTVEVTGTRFVEPYEVVRAAGLDAGANVFDDPAAWREGALALPLVERVELVRRLPSTISVRVHEVEPIALVATPTLRPVSARGRLLPIEPAGAVLDLPIVQGLRVAEDRVTGEGPAALAAIVALQAQAPDLADRVSQVELSGGGIRLVFRDGSTEALLPVRPSRVQLEQLRLAHSDLAARGELPRVRRIDLRFRDQVVVSFHPSPVG